jgi:hypothetical protein
VSGEAQGGSSVYAGAPGPRLQAPMAASKRESRKEFPLHQGESDF